MLEPSKNRANDDKRKRTGLEKKLIIGISILSIIAVICLILFLTKKSCSSEEECTEKHCVKASAELLDFVNLKKDPCNNFYEYVCGHYIKNAVKKESPTPILHIMSEYQNEMKSSIIDPIRKKDSKANIAMKQFYQACMNESKIDSDHDHNFLETIKELGGWPMINGSNWSSDGFDWVDWHIKSVKLGVPVIGFFSFELTNIANNTGLKVNPSELERFELTKSKFESLMKDVAEAFKAQTGFGTENIEVYDFLKQVKKLTEHVDDEDDDEDDTSIEDLYKICPQFPWLKILNGLAGDLRHFTNDSEVTFGNLKKYCHHLDLLLKKTPKRIIADYYVWSIIQNTHDFLSKDIRSAYEDLEETDEGRFKTCFALTDRRFQYLKETIYIRRKTNPTVRKQLEELIEIMKEVFIEHIKKSTWMDEETRTRAIGKTKLIEKIIGADDELYNETIFDKFLGVNSLEFTSDNPYQIIKEKNIKENQHIWESINETKPDSWDFFFERANAVNAFFAQPLNLMIIPAPILNSVFFNYKMPAFMNYGAIGRVVGHEIMHGFGETGRQVILENDETIDWWTNATAEAFNTTKQCVIDEYEKIPFRYKLNGTLTLEENLADYVSVDVAYESYERWVQKYGEEKKLPGIPLTPRQIFWIKTGAFLCFRKLDDEDVDMESEDVHAIPAFRVTAGAKNSLYFAKDFNCPEGSVMNPKQKCRIL